MSGRPRPRLAMVLGALLAVATSAVAPAPVPPGFHSTGTLVVQANFSGTPLNVGGTIVFYERGSSYRLDLLTLAFPGTDPTASALAGALLAPGGATIVYDGATGALGAYSTGNHVYYQSVPSAQPAAAQIARPAPASPGANDPLATLAIVARQLHDVASASIQLTGHSVTNGHPTDDLDVLVRRQRPGKPLENYHAQLALADDLDGLPVRVALSSTPATPQDFGGSLRLDLTAVTRETPDPSVFSIPAGLTRVTSLGEVLQAKH